MIPAIHYFVIATNDGTARNIRLDPVEHLAKNLYVQPSTTWSLIGWPLQWSSHRGIPSKRVLETRRHQRPWRPKMAHPCHLSHDFNSQPSYDTVSWGHTLPGLCSAGAWDQTQDLGHSYCRSDSVVAVYAWHYPISSTDSLKLTSCRDSMNAGRART